MTSSSLIMSRNPWMEDKKEEQLSDDEHENIIDVVRKVARSELRESDCTREQCLVQFKSWINKNPDIENCIIDDNFLLRFLRAKKFSLPMAQQTLLKYLNLRAKYKHIFYDMDYLDPKVSELINNGYIFVSPSRDKYGRRVVITNIYKLDPYRFSSTDQARAHLITYETIIDDEENQVLGVTHIGDGGGVQAGHVGMWSIAEFATLLKWGEQSFPMRHKSIHIVNLPSAIKYVIDFACTRVTQKLRDRLKIYTSHEDFHREVDKSILPKEYGGTMEMKTMIELWKKELEAKRERLLAIDTINLLSDRGIIRRRDKIESNDVIGLQGSFRKLEVD